MAAGSSSSSSSRVAEEMQRLNRGRRSATERIHWRTASVAWTTDSPFRQRVSSSWSEVVACWPCVWNVAENRMRSMSVGCETRPCLSRYEFARCVVWLNGYDYPSLYKSLNRISMTFEILRSSSFMENGAGELLHAGKRSQ